MQQVACTQTSKILQEYPHHGTMPTSCQRKRTSVKQPELSYLMFGNKTIS
uniref:Uncharacterized protein n=1 Tax=Arundo donax TaxID=35708 RepID=A0A0A8YWB6_ARUDO